MKNAFLPTQVHYANSKDHKNAVQIAENNSYEAIYFDPKNLDNNKAFMLYETENDFRVLYIEYDSCLDRFHPSEDDTIHVFDKRSTAFRYLEKVSRLNNSRVDTRN